MAKRSDRTLVVGLDIGTSKVVALVGELTSDGAIELTKVEWRGPPPALVAGQLL